MKRFGIFLGFVLISVVGTALAVPLLIDVNQYKGEIEGAASDALGRDVDIGGNISLGLLTGVKLEIEDLSVANIEAGRGDKFLTLEEAEVRLAVLPLLSGVINIKEVRLAGPRIWFEQFSDGTNNLPLPDDETQEPSGEAANEDQTAEGLSYDVVVDALTIENGIVTYFDHATGDEKKVNLQQITLSLDSLDGPFSVEGTLSVMERHFTVNAAIGDITQANTRVRAEVALTDASGTEMAGLTVNGLLSNLEQAPEFTGMLSAKTADGSLGFEATQVQAGESRVAIGDGVIALGGANLDVMLEGTLGEMPDIALSLSAGRLELAALLEALDQVQGFTDTVAPAEDAAGSSVISDETDDAGNSLPTDLRLSFDIKVDALAMNDDAVRQIAVSGLLAGGQIALDKASAQLPGSGEMTLALASDKRQSALTLDGQLDLAVRDLPRFAAWASLDLPADAQQGTYQQIAAKIPFRATMQGVASTGLKATLDRSSLTGSFAYDMRVQPAQLTYRLSVDRFDADAYFPAEDAEKKPQSENTEARAQHSEGKDDNNNSSLPALAVNGRFDVASLTYGGVVYRNVMLQTDIVSAPDNLIANIGFQALPYQLAVKANYMPKAGEARLERLTFASRKSRVSGTAMISGLGEGARAKFKAALSGPYLDMNDLLPPTVAAQGGTTSTSSRSGVTGHERWSVEPLPLQPLRLADGTFSLALDQFIGYGLDIVDMKGQASLQDGILRLDDFSGNLFGGPMQANGMFDASQDQTQMKFDFAFRGANLEKVDLGFWRKGRFAGLVDGTMAFTSNGSSMLGLVKGLGGDIKFAGEKGALRGMDMRRLGMALRNFNKGGAAQVLPALSQGETPFNDLDMWLSFKDGVMTSKQVKADVGSDIRLATDMMLDLPSWNAKFATGFFLVEKRDLPPISLLFYGPPDNLKRKLDTEAIQKYYVNSLIQKGVEKLFKF